MPILFRDFETRSTLSLPDVGAWRYATHPETEIWCCAYALDDGPIGLWKPGDPVPPEFIAAAQDPAFVVCAFNDAFERLIEQHIMAPRYGWPVVPIEQHRCLQAAALALALPAKLENVAKALGLTQQKDAAGHKLMMQMAQPRRDGTYFDDPERVTRLHEYCKQDLAAERALYARVGFLSAEEQALWELDAKINARGIYIDGDLLGAAIHVAEKAQQELNAELNTITGGSVGTINQVDALMKWLAEHDCIVTSMQKPVLRKALTRTKISAEARRVIELRLDGAHAATAKLTTMRDWRNGDGRARHCLRYHGASTGRWSSHGIQLQNMKRPIVEDMGAAIAAVATGDLKHLRSKYPQPMSVIGDVTRALICAQPDHRLLVADFSGVESRITAWLSGQDSKLEQWAKYDRTQDPHDEPYFINGHKTFKLPEAEARAPGKTGDLAFGFMGGAGAWLRLAPEGDTSTKEQIEERKRAWRDAHPQTVRFWHALNSAAITAVRYPDTTPSAKRITFKCDETFLRMRLPSGRELSYPFPKLKTNDRGDTVVTFMDNELGKWVECRHGQGAYGGTWIENAVQAVARDLFAAAMPRLEAAGYKIILHVHDEIVVEAPNGFGSVEEFLQIITTQPDWADGLPIAAKARNGQRFCKTIKPEKSDAGGDDGAPEITNPEPSVSVEPEPDATPNKQNGRARMPNALAAILGLGFDGEADVASLHAGADDAQDNGSNNNDAEDNNYSSGEQPKGRNVTAYIYRDAGGQPYLKIVRTSAKQFPQYHWEGSRWLKGKPKGPKIPYRLPELLAAAVATPIFICEGEKDADNIATLGFIATTNSEGAGKGKWTSDLNRWFTGRLVVYILEDNDDDGRRHAREVANALRNIVTEVRIISFPELSVKGDVSDWLENHTRDELLDRAKAAPQEKPDGYVLVRASDIVPRRMDWLWQGHILRGSQELLTGVPGGGKSQIHCAFVAYVTTGKAWPDGANGTPPGNVIMLTAEDCLDQTIVPRLIVAGADRERVHILKKIRKDNKERMFLLAEDLDILAEMIAKLGDVRLITIDPITAYMGHKLDSHRATDVRGQLGPLADLAERSDVALSAITHPPKHTTQRAIDHFIGSQAFIAAARIGHMTIEEMEEDEHGNRTPTGRSLFTNPKNNISRKMSTLAYRIIEKPLDSGLKAPCIVWEEIVDITADQAVAAATMTKSRDGSSAVIFLSDILANGSVPVKLLEDRATERGLSKDQLKRAKQKMGIVAFKEHGKLDGQWFWALPQHAPKDNAMKEAT
jgi:DNA polymerase bacteriophage-type